MLLLSLFHPKLPHIVIPAFIQMLDWLIIIRNSIRFEIFVKFGSSQYSLP
ncbi:MAG: hypothetical protein N838_07705 [Thiohalocapsa sp. PB-PSB1]|jgi:hypothetical protein|nr:MAG: hypothetical protein N838_07705 [Thiohalocapsa sp. PB-PSB1]